MTLRWQLRYRVLGVFIGKVIAVVYFANAESTESNLDFCGCIVGSGID
ncbi:hypothetical protein [Methylotenera versatilis]|nr:hypothetical protein [Methylotenera versatilis]